MQRWYPIQFLAVASFFAGAYFCLHVLWREHLEVKAKKVARFESATAKDIGSSLRSNWSQFAQRSFLNTLPGNLKIEGVTITPTPLTEHPPHLRIEEYISDGDGLLLITPMNPDPLSKEYLFDRNGRQDFSIGQAAAKIGNARKRGTWYVEFKRIR